jgi:hypothetical protein
MKNEIIIYQADSHSERIEVTLENETVWLSQQQMALLFNQSKQNISLHINNCFKEKELDRNSTVKDSLIVQMEGNREVKRRLEFYSLDVIISVGYRVKSIKGTQFRIWANRILTDYLLKGYAINNRMNRFENQLEGFTNQVNQIEVQIKTKDLPVQGIFMDKTWGPFPLLFYRKKVAKSSVKGLRMGAPLLKTDRFGDPAASSRFTDTRKLVQHKPAFQFAMLHA